LQRADRSNQQQKWEGKTRSYLRQNEQKEKVTGIGETRRELRNPMNGPLRNGGCDNGGPKKRKGGKGGPGGKDGTAGDLFGNKRPTARGAMRWVKKSGGGGKKTTGGCVGKNWSLGPGVEAGSHAEKIQKTRV